MDPKKLSNKAFDIRTSRRVLKKPKTKGYMTGEPMPEQPREDETWKEVDYPEEDLGQAGKYPGDKARAPDVTARYKKFRENLTKAESKVVLALRSLLKESLNEDTSLQDMLNKVKHDVDETAHNSQFRWEGIDDAFKLKVGDSPFADSITSAFFQTHNYKYLDNPTFKLSFERELKHRAVPTNEIQAAMGYVDSMVSDLSKNPAEQDTGWNPNMKDIVDLTSNADNRTAKPTDPFTGGGVYPENDTYDKGSLEGF